MTNNDRITNAIDNIIDALNEIKQALKDQQEEFVPKVTISDEPPEEVMSVVSFSDEIENEAVTDTQPATYQSPIEVAEPEPIAMQPPERRFCLNCGNELRPSAKFCALCGKAV